MGTAYYPGQSFDSVSVSVNGSPMVVDPLITNPYIIFKVGDITYPNGYTVNYIGGYRKFYATLDSNRNVYVSCYTVAYGEDLPAFNLTGVQLYVVGQNYPTPAAITISGMSTNTTIPYIYKNSSNVWTLLFYYTDVNYANAYSIYTRQTDASVYTLNRSVSPVSVGTNRIYSYPIPGYNPSLPLQVRVAVYGTDNIEYNSTTFNIHEMSGSLTGVNNQYWSSNYFEWRESYYNGAWSGTFFYWAGTVFTSANWSALKSVDSRSDGYTYSRGEFLTEYVYNSYEKARIYRIYREVTPAEPPPYDPGGGTGGSDSW